MQYSVPHDFLDGFVFFGGACQQGANEQRKYD